MRRENKSWISPFWQAALLPDTIDVCGFILPPLSVWHTYVLENLDNPYLCGGPCDKDAATSLLLIAGRNMAVGRLLFLEPATYRKAVQPVVRRLKGMEWKAIHAACSDYIDTCMRASEAWRSGEGGGRPCGAPTQWHMLSSMFGGDVAKLRDLWDAPYAVLRCLFDARRESDGHVNLLIPDAQYMSENWDEFKDENDVEEVKVGAA